MTFVPRFCSTLSSGPSGAGDFPSSPMAVSDVATNQRIDKKYLTRVRVSASTRLINSAFCAMASYIAPEKIENFYRIQSLVIDHQTRHILEPECPAIAYQVELYSSKSNVYYMLLTENIGTIYSNLRLNPLDNLGFLPFLISLQGMIFEKSSEDDPELSVYRFLGSIPSIFKTFSGSTISDEISQDYDQVESLNLFTCLSETPIPAGILANHLKFRNDTSSQKFNISNYRDIHTTCLFILRMPDGEMIFFTLFGANTNVLNMEILVSVDRSEVQSKLTFNRARLNRMGEVLYEILHSGNRVTQSYTPQNLVTLINQLMFDDWTKDMISCPPYIITMVFTPFMRMDQPSEYRGTFKATIYTGFNIQVGRSVTNFPICDDVSSKHSIKMETDGIAVSIQNKPLIPFKARMSSSSCAKITFGTFMYHVIMLVARGYNSLKPSTKSKNFNLPALSTSQSLVDTTELFSGVFGAVHYIVDKSLIKPFQVSQAVFDEACRKYVETHHYSDDDKLTHMITECSKIISEIMFPSNAYFRETAMCLNEYIFFACKGLQNLVCEVFSVSSGNQSQYRSSSYNHNLRGIAETLKTQGVWIDSVTVSSQHRHTMLSSFVQGAEVLSFIPNNLMLATFEVLKCFKMCPCSGQVQLPSLSPTPTYAQRARSVSIAPLASREILPSIQDFPPLSSSVPPR